MKKNYKNQKSLKLLNGKIILILGPMFSGKTSELFRIYNLYKGIEFNGRKLSSIIIRRDDDNRYDDYNVVTHSNKIEFATSLKRNGLKKELFEKYDVIAIDEGHFFDNVSKVADELANSNKIVIISALNGTFKRKPWDEVSKLISKSDEIITLTALCEFCLRNGFQSNGSFSVKIKGDKKLIEEIGEKDKYLPACRKCFKKFN